MRSTRRALLAGAPAAVVAALASGTAVNGLGPAIAAPSSSDAELLGLAAEFDPLFEQWRQMRIAEDADRDDYEDRLRRASGMTRAEAPELDWEDPDWIAYYGLMKQVGAGGVHRWDEEKWDRLTDELFPLADEILAHEATTREGLALQARAFISSYNEVLEEHGAGVTAFIASVCAFAGVAFPHGEAQS